MNDNEKQILLITMEECAEVQQAISKIFRFGFLAEHPEQQGKNNLYRLEEELGDLLCCIGLLESCGVVSPEKLELNKQKKLEKLKRWSTIDLPNKME